MTERAPTFPGFRDYLWDVLPESREHILYEEWMEAQRDDPDWADSRSYWNMSHAFVHPVLAEGAQRWDVELIRRCVALVERMLAAGDRDLNDLIQIRVIEKTGHYPGLTELFRYFAGPLTWERMVYTEGLAVPVPVPVPEEPVGDGRPDAATEAFRARLWERIPGCREFLLEAEYNEARTTMSLAAMTPGRYVTEAIVRLMVPRAETYGLYSNPDPEMTEKTAAGLELLLEDPDTAALLHPHRAEIAAAARTNLFLRAYAGPHLGKLLQA